MMDCISVENMRLSDAMTIAESTSGIELMYRAAYGVYLASQWHAPVAIVVGSGNNGGDGFALACILKEQNIACTVFTLSQKLSDDSAFYARKAAENGVNICSYTYGCFVGHKMIVDCLLGTGFQGSLRESYRTVIKEINASKAFILSVDINSGMNGDTGDAELAICSDLTVTIGYVKNGLITENAGRYMKRLVCVDIGIRLAKLENKIVTEGEWSAIADTGRIPDNYFRAPAWLDLNTFSIRNICKY